MKSKPPEPINGSSALAQNPRTSDSTASIRRGREDPGEQATVQIVQRRILEQQDARRHLDVVEQNVGGGAAAGPVGLPVRQFARHVLVPTQRIEVVLFVVVQRCFLTHPLPHRVWVVVDVGIVWVVIQLDRFGACHLLSGPFQYSVGCSVVAVQEAMQNRLDELLNDHLPRRRLGAEVGGSQRSHAGDHGHR